MCSLPWLFVCVLLLQTHCALSFHLHLIADSDKEVPSFVEIFTLPVEAPSELNLQLELGHDLIKAYAPADLYHIVQRLVIGVFHLMQQPSFWSKNKKIKKQKQPSNQKQTINPLTFGNLSFGVGFTFNIQLSNIGIGFNRQRDYEDNVSAVKVVLM